MDMPSKCGIYRIVNAITLKVYVGSAVDIARRQREHLKMLRAGTHHSQRLQRSFAKWGEGAFEFEVIELTERASLLEREQDALDLHHAADDSFGYNICATAGSNLGRTFGPETREKIRRANLGKKQSAELIERRIGSLRGKPLSSEHRAAVSASKRGRSRPDIAEWAPKKLSRFGVTEVASMRARRAAGATYRALATEFNCTVSTAHQVVNEKGAFYASL